jgi:putative transposase
LRAFGSRCTAADPRLSISPAGEACDNARCDSFLATRESELLDRHRFRSHGAAEMAVFDFINGFYDPSRRRSELGEF